MERFKKNECFDFIATFDCTQILLSGAYNNISDLNVANVGQFPFECNQIAFVNIIRLVSIITY